MRGEEYEQKNPDSTQTVPPSAANQALMQAGSYGFRLILSSKCLIKANRRRDGSWPQWCYCTASVDALPGHDRAAELQ